MRIGCAQSQVTLEVYDYTFIISRTLLKLSQILICTGQCRCVLKSLLKCTRTHITHIFVVCGARTRTPVFEPALTPFLKIFLKKIIFYDIFFKYLGKFFFQENWSVHVQARAHKLGCGCVRRTLRKCVHLSAGADENPHTLKVCGIYHCQQVNI